MDHTIADNQKKRFTLYKGLLYIVGIETKDNKQR